MLGDIFGVDVMVFLTIFSLISFCLISFVRLFSMSFISFEMAFFGGGVLSLLPLLAAPVDLRVLTALEDDDDDWMTVVLVVVVLLLLLLILADCDVFWLDCRLDDLAGVVAVLVSKSSVISLSGGRIVLQQVNGIVREVDGLTASLAISSPPCRSPRRPL